MAGQLQRGNAQQHPEETRYKKGCDHAHPDGHAQLRREEGRGVGPYSPEGRLGQRELSRVAQDDVQPQAGDRRS